jgi:hypothetical protein
VGPVERMSNRNERLQSDPKIFEFFGGES